MLASISTNTLRQYGCALRQWDEFCHNKRIKILDITVPNVLNFMAERFEFGASYGTLNSIRSALSLLSKDKIGIHPDISRFMTGVQNKRPPRPKYSHTWDTNIVLDYLSLLDCTSLKNLTLKTVMLIALSTAQRAQTISFIKISNIKVVSNGLVIEIPDRIKTSKAGRDQPLLQLPLFSDKPRLCVVTAINEYLEKTKEIRNDIDSLFLILNLPRKSVCSETISRWLKECLCMCGIDTTIFTGHSTRHASGSKADLKGLDIDTIRRTATWSKRSQIFAKFYNRPIIHDGFEFARTVIG